MMKKVVYDLTPNSISVAKFILVHPKYKKKFGAMKFRFSLLSLLSLFHFAIPIVVTLNLSA